MFEFINKIRAIAKIDIGSKYYRLGNYEKALKYFDKASKIKPDCKYAFAYKGGIYGILNDFENAFKCFDKAISIDSNYIYPWIQKIDFALGKYDYNFDINTVNKGLELNKNNLELLNSKIGIFVDCKRFEEALLLADHGLSLNPNNRTSMYVKSMVFSRMGFYEEAIKECEDMIKFHPDFPDGWHGLAFCNYKLGNFELSLKFIKKAISIEYLESYAFFYITLLVEEFEDYELALKEINVLFNEIKDLPDKSTFADIYFFKAKIMDKKSNDKVAIENYEKAIYGYLVLISEYYEKLEKYGEIILKNDNYVYINEWKEKCSFSKDRLNKLKSIKNS